MPNMAPLRNRPLPKKAANASAATTRAEDFRQQHAIAFQVTAGRAPEQAAVEMLDLESTRCAAIHDVKWMQRANERALSRVTDAISEKDI